MRLLLIAPAWPFRGGIARCSTRLAVELRNRHGLVGYLAPLRQYPAWLYPGKTDRDETFCERLDFVQRCFSPFEPWTWPSAARRAASLFPDVLLFPHWTAAYYPVARFLRASLRVPSIALVHNLSDHGAGLVSRKWSTIELNGYEGYLAHDQSTEQELRRHFPSKPVFHCAEPAYQGEKSISREKARKALGVEESAKAVLFFGLIRPYKGIDVFLEAMSLLHEQNLTVLIAGEPWRRERVALTKKISLLSEKIKVISRLEWISESESNLWFQSADVAVLPYHASSGSGVAARARGAGLPLVVSHVGGLKDLPNEEGQIIFTEPGNPHALARAVQSMLHFSQGLKTSLPPAVPGWGDYADVVESLAGETLKRKSGLPRVLNSPGCFVSAS